jgi:hypothetical protein
MQPAASDDLREMHTAPDLRSGAAKGLVQGLVQEGKVVAVDPLFFKYTQKDSNLQPSVP